MERGGQVSGTAGLVRQPGKMMIQFARKFVGNKAKVQISKRVFQENKASQIFQKTNISYPDTKTYVCVSGGNKCSFFDKFDVLCFLGTPVLRLALLPYYQRISDHIEPSPPAFTIHIITNQAGQPIKWDRMFLWASTYLGISQKKNKHGSSNHVKI